MRQTGEIADGWIPIYWPKDKIASGVETIMEGAKKAGKSRADITVAPSIVMQITDAGSAEQVRAQARGPIAFYVGRMGTYYYEMLIRNGFEDEVNTIRAGWEARDAKAAAAGVSDRMLDQTAVVGPLDRCKEDLDERRALGVDLPLIGMPGRDAAEMGKILENTAEVATPAEGEMATKPRPADGVLPLTPPIEPMLAKLTPDIPEGDGWQYEPKWDGFRCARVLRRPRGHTCRAAT